MKKILTVLIIFFASCGNMFSQWVNYDFSSNLDAGEDIYFLNKDTGFIVGNFSGTNYIYSRIYRTTNGGSTWSNVLSVTTPTLGSTNPYPSHSLHKIFFPTPLKGFCVGSLNDLHPFVASTVNGGVTWDTLTLTSVNHAMNGIFFSSPLVGYMTGGSAINPTALLKTIDGGSTWTDITTAATAVMGGNGIDDSYFLTDTHGFAVTLASSGQQAGIYETHNGGGSWTQVLQLDSNNGFHAVQFIDSLHGYAASTLGRCYITSNGGATWTRSTIPSGQLDAWDIYFFNPMVGYVASGSGFFGGIYKTTNGGSSWTLDNSGSFYVTTTYYALSFKGGKGNASGISGWSRNNNIVVGVNEIRDDVNISVYPNPGNGMLNIELKQFDKASVEIYNTIGQKVLTQVLNANVTQLDLSNVNNGVYQVRLVKDNTVIYAGRVVKE